MYTGWPSTVCQPNLLTMILHHKKTTIHQPLFVCLLIFILSSLTTANAYRLPKTFHPENYRLKVITRLNEDGQGHRFTGKVWIVAICDENTNNITLHAKNLTINEEKVKVKLIHDKIEIKEIKYDDENDFLIIMTNETFRKGNKYMIYIPFEAPLSSGLSGYYMSSYFDQKKKEKVYLSVTQFEPTAARDGEKDFVLDTFETSVPMSTYLVAYTVNDFEFREAPVKTKDDVKFRIWARRDAIDQVEYAKVVGPKVLKYYEEYFDIKFPLPKMDMIAIPDFSAGAMENWGLITYRETALLYAPNVSSSSNQHRVASVIAHELAHQWFGNYVTMKWWTDLWLNEGFATYVASLGVEFLHPEWNSLTEESVDNTLNIFRFDALKSSHAVSIPIGHPSQITQIFDAISYSKGSCIIRMMHLFMGEETFKNGVSNYLKSHKYRNAEQDDLWHALTEEAHRTGALPKTISVKQIMDSWTLKVGYPVITVTRDYTNNSVEIVQERYLLDVIRSRDETLKCWYVPLSFTSQKERNFSLTNARDWLECDCENQDKPKMIYNMPDENDWILFNVQMSGLYKVKYDEKNWDLLIAALNGPNFKQIDTINRAQLINDALDFAWTGEQNYEVALSVVNYLRQEEEYLPWKSALDGLSVVNRILHKTPLYDVFRSYMQGILEPIYTKVGGLKSDRKSTDRLDVVKRKVMIAAWSCKFDVSDCVDKAVSYFKAWMEESDPDTMNPVPVDLRRVVYCNAIKHGREREWNFLWQRYVKSNVASEKVLIIGSLACSRQIWILSRYLDWSLNATSGVRKQDGYHVFGSVARSEAGFELAKNFLYDKIDMIYEYLYPEESRLARYVKPLAEHMTTLKELTDLRNLVTMKPKVFEKASQGVKQALETVELNNQWKHNNYMDMSRHLSSAIYRSMHVEVA
uniref:Aminopeptidase n=1 Tax=Culicoides sonorensis TaxID=179676 RepID=A0A336M458_CULSO